MTAKDVIESLLGHDLSKRIYFEVELTGGQKCEVEITGVTAKNEMNKGRSTSPRLVLTGGTVDIKAEVKLEVEVEP